MHLSPLLTDLYELTMLAGYFEEGMADTQAVFDLYFRTNPFAGGYAVFAGLEPALDCLEHLHFSTEELDYLHSLGLFTPRFLDFLRNFRFQGSVVAPPEGTVVFANDPLLTVSGSLAEVQLVETVLLNLINFQTLVATKAARICHAAAGAEVIEFGLRRAQGPDGGLSASRAACVGGAKGTSNVLAGMAFGLPVRGTHAHSWVQSFPDELAAFRAYAAAFPDSSVLLVDTYDTLGSGVPNAIVVARELRAQGHSLRAIRLDSGDLAYLSREARHLLNAAGFPEVRILASNELDEQVIGSIRDEGGRVDIYGVGTKLATAAGIGGGALGGVYKLVAIDGRPKMKITSDMAKATLPGNKRLLRAIGPDGNYVQDVICLEDDTIAAGDTVFDPVNPLQWIRLSGNVRLVDLRQTVMADGRRLLAPEPLERMAERCRHQLALLPRGCRRFVNPHRYKVSISAGLKEMRGALIQAEHAGRRCA
ncbi:MAG: nicotinate phosphoribosyltransferase [Desulfobulbus sp.]|uniref:nicotinate phosphoribosyltransferase n=1 Tax=Desulfobulbus sp. TaxID=895 RepID=UPI00284370AF|nr:nicotinate phosphoribosyltransferase [Desulfobulbus sp.]MDR2550421.1 nicotinate phosphoribosyltransferase [Desulfobulbus sp.]